MAEYSVSFGFLMEENQDFPSGSIFDVKKNGGMGLIEDNL
jgi:hypothetical protein